MLSQAKLHKIKPGGKLTLGPFSIEFIHVTHSIVSCVLLAITTPLGVIIHTGDYKVDPTPTDNELFDLHTLAAYGKRGVLLLMSDSTSTSIGPDTQASERAVGPRLEEELFVRSPRRLDLSLRFQLALRFIACGKDSTDLARVWHHRRRVALPWGASMTNTTELAHDLGRLTIPNGILLRPQDIMQTPRPASSWRSPRARKVSPCPPCREWPSIITSRCLSNRATP